MLAPATGDQITSTEAALDQPGPQRPPLAAEMDPSNDCRYYIERNIIDEAPPECQAIIDALLNQPVYQPTFTPPKKVQPAQVVLPEVRPNIGTIVRESNEPEVLLESGRNFHFAPLTRGSFQNSDSEAGSDTDSD